MNVYDMIYYSSDTPWLWRMCFFEISLDLSPPPSTRHVVGSKTPGSHQCRGGSAQSSSIWERRKHQEKDEMTVASGSYRHLTH